MDLINGGPLATEVNVDLDNLPDKIRMTIGATTQVVCWAHFKLNAHQDEHNSFMLYGPHYYLARVAPAPSCASCFECEKES